MSSKIYRGRKFLKLAKNVKPGNCLPRYLHIGKGFNHPNSILRSIGRSFASPPEPELAPRLSLGCNSMQFKNSLLSADFICEWSRYFCLSELSSLEGRCLCHICVLDLAGALFRKVTGAFVLFVSVFTGAGRQAG